jgi:glycosyltransferase involved in cell wall biosynthesis
MRVLFITSAYPANADDPRGTFIHVLARSLVKQGLEVVVLAPGSPGTPTSELRDGVRIWRATYWIPRWQSLATGLGGIVPNLLVKPWLICQVPALVAALAWRAAELARQVDLIHAHWVYPSGVAGAFAGWMRKKPVIMTSHGGDVNLAMRSPLLRMFTRWTARRADVCIGVSHAMAGRLVRLGVEGTKVRFVPLGVDIGEPDPGKALRKSPCLSTFAAFDGLRVVFAGSLIPRKSVQTLLEAQRWLVAGGHQVASLIIGDGPCAAKLHREAGSSGSGLVCFVASQPPDEVPSYMALGNVFVLPSLSEGRGLVIVEAMMTGLPVVSSDIDGPRELVADGLTGFLFQPGNAAGLASCLERFVSDQSLSIVMGARARQAVREAGLTADCSARQHIAVYGDILGRGVA